MLTLRRIGNFQHRSNAGTKDIPVVDSRIRMLVKISIAHAPRVFHKFAQSDMARFPVSALTKLRIISEYHILSKRFKLD